MKIDWEARVKNKAFWLALIPAVLLLVTQVAGIFGITVDFTALQDQLLAVVGTVFSLLVIFGVIADPTTDGFGDKPKEE